MTIVVMKLSKNKTNRHLKIAVTAKQAKTKLQAGQEVSQSQKNPLALGHSYEACGLLLVMAVFYLPGCRVTPQIL